MANYQKTYENTWNELTNKEKNFTGNLSTIKLFFKLK